MNFHFAPLSPSAAAQESANGAEAKSFSFADIRAKHLKSNHLEFNSEHFGRARERRNGRRRNNKYTIRMYALQQFPVGERTLCTKRENEHRNERRRGVRSFAPSEILSLLRCYSALGLIEITRMQKGDGNIANNNFSNGY